MFLFQFCRLCGSNPPLYHRYTPLLAHLLTPNTHLPFFGKLLFVLADLLIGLLLHKITSSTTPHLALLSSAAWLLNPIAAGVSTRGNAEPILGLVILATIYFARKNFVLCGLFLSLSVHFKLYPIIYSLPLYLYIAYVSSEEKCFISWSTVRFVGTFFITQVALFIPLYHYYGYEFVYETYLYHFIRSDTRHNFSPYFYMLYLQKYSSSMLAGFTKFTCFLPQALLMLIFSFKFYKHLELCLVIQTIGFVIFNKVSTSQYFLWYLWLLPLIIPRLKMSWREAVVLVGAWLLGQGVWLLSGFLVEFQGHNSFLLMHGASLMFLLIQCKIIQRLINCYVC